MFCVGNGNVDVLISSDQIQDFINELKQTKQQKKKTQKKKKELFRRVFRVFGAFAKIKSEIKSYFIVEKQ